VVEDAQKIVRFIRARHVPLALFRKHAAIHAKGLSLLSPGATRFATNFLMVVRVLNVKEALKQRVIDVEWDTTSGPCPTCRGNLYGRKHES
jgi:hypothetical protein